MGLNVRLQTYYLSQHRLLSMLDVTQLEPIVLAALKGESVVMAKAILSGAVGKYLIKHIGDGSIRTLAELQFEGRLENGRPFIYDGHVYGKGFGFANKGPIVSLSEKLSEPLAGRKLVVEFSKSGLTNDTAYSRLSGSVANIFIYGYITEVTADLIKATPYVIGDLVDDIGGMILSLIPRLEVRPEMIEQFSKMDEDWQQAVRDLPKMRFVPEAEVKQLICELLGEVAPKDWGGEESDVFTSNLVLDGKRVTAAFLLKGPARFHPMVPTDLGKNGDQLYRLFNIPADVYVVQHCHGIGPAVRSQARAFATSRSFNAPCRLVFMDGLATMALLKAYGRWPPKLPTDFKAARGRKTST